MVKSFASYLMESEREYHFRVKTIVELDEDRLNRIERLLAKYDLRDMSRPKKTIMQKHPLDFQDMDHAEVFILDIVTGLPASSYILQQEIRAGLQISEKFIVVRTDNDPLELETERLNTLADISAEAAEKGLEKDSLLSTDSEYRDAEKREDGDKFYGDDYNSKLLGYLAKVSATRKPDEIQPHSTLFDFMNDDIEEVSVDQDEVTDDFNDDIEDAPRSVPWWEALDDDSDIIDSKEEKISPAGNFDDDFTSYTRVYIDPKTGKEKEISATTNSIRAGKKKGK